MQRRDFLHRAGLLSAISVLKPGDIFAAPPAKLQAGLQLYTLRDYLGRDVDGVLAKVAKAGYTVVETYGYSKEKGFWGLPAAQFKAALRAHGLTTTSGHYDMSGFFRDGSPEALKAYLAAAQACGQTYLVVPYLDEQVRATPDDFKRVAERLNQAGELGKAAGVRLGYHNHDFEFKTIGGTSLYEVLLRETTPALVDFELDLYWAVRAGQDPVQLFKQHPGRFTLWHVKDMDKARPELNTEIGAGSINFRELFKYAPAAGLKQLFVEQENFGMDAYQSIAQSAAYLKKLLL